MSLWRRRLFGKEAVRWCQPLMKEQGQFNQWACQVIAVLRSAGVIHQNLSLSAGSSPSAHYCTPCQHHNPELLAQSKCFKRSQERLSEEDCHLWGVEFFCFRKTLISQHTPSQEFQNFASWGTRPSQPRSADSGKCDS